MSKPEARAFIDGKRGDRLSNDEMERAIKTVFWLRFAQNDEQLAEKLASVVATEINRREIETSAPTTRGLGRR